VAATKVNQVLVIGGGHPQMCLIEALCELGERVVALDDRPHVPAHRIADQVVPIHRYDHEAIATYAQAHPPSYVASGGSDRAVHIAAHLAESLEVPTYLSAATAELPMRKAATRELLAAAGVGCPATVYGAGLGTFRDLDWDRLRFPVVVKPDQGIGQTAVDRAETPTEALASVEAALAATGNGLVVVQELISGDEVGVNGIVLDGQFRLLTTSYRRSSRQRGQEFGVAMEKVFPAVTEQGHLDELSTTIQQACLALGIDNGPIYAQVIMTLGPGDGVRFTIIEIMPRLGGGEDPRLVYAATGTNLAKATALLWLGRPVVLDELQEGTPHPKVILRFFRAHPGQVTTITGLDAARAVLGILAADVFVHPGQQIAALSSSRERTGYILAAGTNPEEAAAKAEAMVTIQTV
jgi:biotin carboxylase